MSNEPPGFGKLVQWDANLSLSSFFSLSISVLISTFYLGLLGIHLKLETFSSFNQICSLNHTLRASAGSKTWPSSGWRLHVYASSPFRWFQHALNYMSWIWSFQTVLWDPNISLSLLLQQAVRILIQFNRLLSSHVLKLCKCPSGKLSWLCIRR